MTRRTSADVQGRPQTPADVRVPHPPPANDQAALRTFEALVEEFGFGSRRAVRDWCRRRGVPYWRDGGYTWADRNEVVAAIRRRRVHVVPPKPAASVESWVESTLGGKARG